MPDTSLACSKPTKRHEMITMKVCHNTPSALLNGSAVPYQIPLSESWPEPNQEPVFLSAIAVSFMFSAFVKRNKKINVNCIWEFCVHTVCVWLFAESFNKRIKAYLFTEHWVCYFCPSMIIIQVCDGRIKCDKGKASLN